MSVAVKVQEMVLVEGPPVKKNPFGQAVIVGGAARENHQIGQHAVSRTSVNKQKGKLKRIVMNAVAVRPAATQMGY